MSAKKRILMGSLFEFSKPGEVIELLQDRLSAGQSPCFVTYDEKKKIFVFEIDRGTDASYVCRAVTQLAAYIESNQTIPQDLTRSPRLKPITGTTLHEQPLFNERNDLNPRVLLDYESEPEVESPTPSAGMVSAYWTPRKGDIDAVTSHIASTIANRTGCSLFAEPAERRIKLANGDFRKAQMMLDNLEKFMTLSLRHRSPAKSRLNANILILSTQGRKSAIKLAKLLEPHPGVDRIILPKSQQALIERLLVVEARIKRRDTEEYYKPLNLDLDPDVVESVGKITSCSLFNKMETFAIGSRQNAVPCEILASPFAQPNSLHQASPSKFMAQTKMTRVVERNHQVDVLAAPDLAPQLTRPDDASTSRKCVDEESDSESGAEVLSEADQQEGNCWVQRQMPTSFTRDTVRHKVNLPGAMNVAGGREDSDRSARILWHRPERATTLGNANQRHAAHRSSTPDAIDSVGSQEDRSTCQWSHARDGPKIQRPQLTPFATAPSKRQIHRPAVRKGFSFRDASKSIRSATNDTYVTCQDVNARMLSDTPRKLIDSSGISFDQTPITENDLIDSQHISTDFGRSNSSDDHDNDQGRYGTKVTSKIQGDCAQEGLGAHALIDVTNSTEASPPIQPPPGYEYRTQLQSSQNVNLIDTDLDSIQSPPLRPMATLDITDSFQRIFSTGSMSAPLSRMLSYTPRPVVRKRDLNVLKQQARAQLQANADRKTNPVPGLDQHREVPSPSNKSQKPQLDQANEHSKKVLLPNKGKPVRWASSPSFTSESPQAESKKEKVARIARVKAEAYGDANPVAQAPKSVRVLTQEPHQTCAPKQQLILSDISPSAMHLPPHLQATINAQTGRMMPKLCSLFEACRAFPGHVEFEFQLGQALVIQDGSFNNALLYEAKDWNTLMAPSRMPTIESVFTNMVTRNGYEIDQLLEMRGAEPQSRLWTKQSIDRPATLFEFQCQDKSGMEFTIQVDSSGSHKIWKSKSIVGKIALHFPEQIWDACASLHGCLFWDEPPPDIADGMADFMNSIHIPPKSQAVVYFRQPKNRAFSVGDVVVRRTSVHGCLVLDREDAQLKVSEVKMLLQSTHPTDRSLHRSSEGEDDEMRRGGRIHYEAAIVNRPINDALLQHNNSIQLGDLTPQETTGTNLISFNRLYQMLEVLTHVIQEADWLGSTNYGTYRRLLDNIDRTRAEIEATLPSHIATRVGSIAKNLITDNSYQHSKLSTSITCSNMNPLDAKTGLSDSHNVRGIRVGETAPLYKQGDRYFLLGLGGAQIPVPAADLTGSATSIDDSIMPSDSVSQSGGDATKRRGTQAHQRRELEKPPGFW